MSNTLADLVSERARRGIPDTLETLCSYLTVPAISCEPIHHCDVRRLAEWVRDDLEAMGMDRARVIEIEDSLPIVAAEWLRAGPESITILIYGHLDLQPVEGEPWRTPPHKAMRQGDRLYARGAADDMGGWLSHIAAIQAWFDEHSKLPCNLKLIIEGEEEIGSPNLEKYMDAYPDVFDADIMVLTDCDNPSVDQPGLTVSLRGLLEVDLTVQALEADVHSGIWGGMTPDVSITLIKLIDRLTDEDGRLSVGRVEVDKTTKEDAWKVPIDDEVIRKGAHLIEGVSPLPHRGTPPAEWLWYQPAITVVATTLPRPEEKKNALRAKASATLSIRLAPGQTIEEMIDDLNSTLRNTSPQGVKVTLTAAPWSTEGWLYHPTGPAFDAADRAYSKSWGHPLIRIGIGGSIPFVTLFGRRYSHLPLILNGVMDPETTAHGPNESMHLGVFEKAVAANVYLYDELATLNKNDL